MATAAQSGSNYSKDKFEVASTEAAGFRFLN